MLHPGYLGRYPGLDPGYRLDILGYNVTALNGLSIVIPIRGVVVTHSIL